MADSTYRATVTRVTTEGLFLEVPQLGDGVEYGPCDVLVPAVALSAVDDDPYTEHDSDDLAIATAHTSRTFTHNHVIGGYDDATQQHSITLEPHRHAVHSGLSGFKTGDKVLVTTIGGIPDDLVVLGVLA